MYINPVHHQSWDPFKSEVVELPDVYYRVIASDGKTVLSESDTREDALRLASASILLPRGIRI